MRELSVTLKRSINVTCLLCSCSMVEFTSVLSLSVIFSKIADTVQMYSKDVNRRVRTKPNLHQPTQQAVKEGVREWKTFSTTNYVTCDDVISTFVINIELTTSEPGMLDGCDFKEKVSFAMFSLLKFSRRGKSFLT